MSRGRGVKGGDPGGPFLKWAGGKGKLLALFEPLYPEKFAAYHEPFLGAGAVFFRLRARGSSGPARLSDSNRDLVLAWTAVRDRVEELIKRLRRLESVHGDEAYYRARERFNTAGLDDFERAALVIYLNKTGFNGLYRVNSRGEYNVPMGRYLRPNICDEPVLRRASERLAGVRIEERDFETVRKHARKGDFVYFDPPYDPLSRSAKFTSYATAGFGSVEQERLARTFAALDRGGVQVMLSNHDTPLVRELYQGKSWDYRVVARVGRAINSRADRRGVGVAEVVVRNYGA